MIGRSYTVQLFHPFFPRLESRESGGAQAAWWGSDDKRRAASPTRQSFGAVSARQCTTSVPRARTRVLHVSISCPLVTRDHHLIHLHACNHRAREKRLEDSVSSGFPSRVSVPCGRTEERGGSEAGSSQIPGLYRVHELRYGYAGRVANALIVGEYFFFFFPFECARANRVVLNRSSRCCYKMLLVRGIVFGFGIFIAVFPSIV